METDIFNTLSFLDVLHFFGMDYVLNPQKRLYWAYLLSSLFIMFLVLKVSRQSLSSLFKKNIWWHTSARLDYGYFIIASMIKLSLILPWMFSINEVAFYVLQWMQATLGYQVKLSINRYALMFLYTMTLFVSSDFSRYWLHRLLHKVPLLWAFHKVHHSAEVLTPITFYRVHPVENILFGIRYALVAGGITGIFAHYFGATLAMLDILGINFFIVLMHFVGDNLRHSPVRFRYYKTLENWFISPAQHQYHHTITGNNVNFGGSLAIWDRLFGTLKHSNKNELYHFGIKDGKQYDSLLKLLFTPFKKIFSYD
jgi:sterol desaturase/sphingolipid hydroxylase (fatty acid hydroxylase superfamily)